MFENMIGALVVDIALDTVNFVAGCPWKVHVAREVRRNEREYIPP